MSIRFLLDTNVVSEPLGPKPNAKVLSRLERHQEELAIAAVVWHELWFGCLRLPKSAKRTATETYLNDVVAATMAVLPYDERAAEWHAMERARLASIGRLPTFVDGLIAATAYTNELTLVTLHTADFRDFSGLAVEDWSS